MSARRISNPRTGEIRLVDEGPAYARTSGNQGGEVVRGMSADEVRALGLRIAHAEYMRAWRLQHGERP